MPFFLYELLENCRRLVGLQAVNALEGSRNHEKLINFALPFPRIFKRWGTCTYVIGTHVDGRRLRSCHAHSGLHTGPKEARASFHYDHEARIQSRVFSLVFFQLSWTKFCRTDWTRTRIHRPEGIPAKKKSGGCRLHQGKSHLQKVSKPLGGRIGGARCLSFSWSSFCASELYT